MPLFEIAFVRVPTIVEQERGVSEKLLGGPFACIGSDQSGAVVEATRKLPTDVVVDSNVKILIRPFS